MNKNNTYTEKDIEVLSDRDHVRIRLPVYAGSIVATTYKIPIFENDKLTLEELSLIPASLKCINEILDNSVDELIQCTHKNKTITIEANPALGTYTISDNGRGVPIGKHESGKYTPEVVFGSLRSGRNFSSDKQSGVIGTNGMGSSITCICSTEFSIDIHRDNKRYRQTFTNGALNISKPIIRKKETTKTGTSVSFILDDTVFDQIALPDQLIRNRAKEIALLNPSITIKYNGETFKYKKGLDNVLQPLGQFFKFSFNSNDTSIEFYVMFHLHNDIDEQIVTWVNSSYLFDGGICNTQFFNAFADKVIHQLEKEAKKNKCTVTKNDIKMGLTIIGDLKLTDPAYDAQSKTRLTGPNLRKEMSTMLDSNWTMFARRNKEWLASVIERANRRHHSKADDKAMKDHQKTLKKKIPGLIDAVSDDRMSCMLLISEGLSAASMITEVRDPETIASIPLSGKINNVHGSTIAQLLKMEKITGLLSAIGLVPGKKAIRGDLQYGKVIITTDADVDGDDIFTLLVNLFYTFWPELLDRNKDPFLFRLTAPNVCLVKTNKRIHFPTLFEYQKVSLKYSGYKVKYYKGLGSMNKQDWEMILHDERCFIPITDDGLIQPALELLFGKSADSRKTWLQSS